MPAAQNHQGKHYGGRLESGLVPGSYNALPSPTTLSMPVDMIITLRFQNIWNSLFQYDQKNVQTSKRKSAKYQELMEECRKRGWRALL